MPRAVAASRAKAEFAECVREAEAGEAIVITRHGRAVAALVPADQLAQLERLRAGGPAAGLAGLAGGWKGSDELVAAAVGARRSRARRLRRSGR